MAFQVYDSIYVIITRDDTNTYSLEESKMIANFETKRDTRHSII